MGYLKVNKQFRLFLGVVGLLVFLYGMWDIKSGEAGRKGLNATKDEQPISYFFTVGKKILIGSGLLIISLSPLLGNSVRVREED